MLQILLGYSTALQCNTYATLMCPIHKFGEVFHPAFSVRVLEEHPTHILSTEVHLMRQLQHSLHSDVTTKYKKVTNYLKQLYTYTLYNLTQ